MILLGRYIKPRAELIVFDNGKMLTNESTGCTCFAAYGVGNNSIEEDCEMYTGDSIELGITNSESPF